MGCLNGTANRRYVFINLDYVLNSTCAVYTFLLNAPPHSSHHTNVNSTLVCGKTASSLPVLNHTDQASYQAFTSVPVVFNTCIPVWITDWVRRLILYQDPTHSHASVGFSPCPHQRPLLFLEYSATLSRGPCLHG